ncbi:hypothetical protein BHE74_00040580, partial [Ensete ventricosum]
MNEAWLAEVGLSPAPRDVQTWKDKVWQWGGQWVGGSIDDVGASLKKRSKKAAPEEPMDASGGTTKVPIGKGREPTGKGKEPVEVEEVHPGFTRGGGLGGGGQ